MARNQQNGQTSPAQPTKRSRVYQQWQGNEKFFCAGHCIAGPNWKSCVGSAFLIAAPTAVFFVFVAPYVAKKVHLALLVAALIFPVLSLLFLFLTACRDPGILPRQEPDEEYLSGRKPRSKEVMVNGHRVTLRYNDTCHFYQPPRAHHCSVNDNCIERFDHHCPWVGTTIGLRNYRTFLLFTFTTSIFCIYVFGCSLLFVFLKYNEVQKEHESSALGTTLLKSIPALVLMAFTLVFFLFVGGLSGFHSYLVATNQTTYENFRYNQEGRRNPYDMGFFNNWAVTFCMPIPPSRINFRAFVDEEKQRRQAHRDMLPTYSITPPSCESCWDLQPSFPEIEGQDEDFRTPPSNFSPQPTGNQYAPNPHVQGNALYSRQEQPAGRVGSRPPAPPHNHYSQPADVPVTVSEMTVQAKPPGSPAMRTAFTN